MLVCLTAEGQRVYEADIPDGISGFDISDYWYELSFDTHILDSLEANVSRNSFPLVFALTEEFNLSPDNSGIIIEKGNELIWYLPLRSSGAKSINIIFSRFRLNEGEKLFIYDINCSLVRGPFTSRNNNPAGVLATLPLPGDEIIVEYHMSRDNPGILEAGKLAHDYLGIISGSGSDTKDYYFGLSGPCNVDVNCSLGDEWQVEKRAVVRILSGGDLLGSGALVNNSNQENIPYVLTAEHLISTASDASESVYIFRYESSWCDGVDGHTDKSISGSELFASNSIIDLALVKLSSFPPVTYKPYLAGWDARAVLPQNTVTIHHPSADVKKISVDLDPPVMATYELKQPNGFWKILQWNYGTTEGGSSGAPLFNRDHRIVGYLTGGEAFCGHSVNDYFARFDIAYDLSSDMFKSLKAWLDPSKTGTSVMNGRDPYASNLELADTLSNITPGDTLLTLYTLPSVGYTTGFNSDSLQVYAESFSYTGTGFLTEIFALAGDVKSVFPGDSVTFFIYDDAGGLPGAVLARKKVLIRESRDTFLLAVDFVLPVEISGNFFAGYKIWYTKSADTDNQQFTVFHTSEVPSSSNSAYYRDESGWHPFTDHPFDPAARHLYISAVVLKNAIYNSDPGNIVPDRMVVYPNPFSDRINIVPGSTSLNKMEIYLLDNSGRVIRNIPIRQKSISAIEGLENLPPGIYYLSISTPEGTETHKMLKTK